MARGGDGATAMSLIVRTDRKEKQILRSPPPNLPQRAKLFGAPETFGAPFVQNDTADLCCVNYRKSSFAQRCQTTFPERTTACTREKFVRSLAGSASRIVRSASLPTSR